MASPYKAFRTSEQLERDGVFLDFGDFRIRIARAGGHNSAYTSRLAAAFRPYRRQIQTDTLGEAKAEEILLNVFADTVVKGWEGVTDEHGNPIEFSRGAVVKLFDDLPDLYRIVREEADKLANFRAEEVEDAAKN